jgi:hypothetical protein
VAIEVVALDGTVTELQRQGVEMASAEAASTPSTSSYFTRPETSEGIPFQFFERTQPVGRPKG